MASQVLNSTIYLFSQPSIECQGDLVCEDKCPFKEAFSQDNECFKFICDKA